MNKTSFKMLQKQHRGLKFSKKKMNSPSLWRQLWVLPSCFENLPWDYGDPGTSEILKSGIKASQDGQCAWMIVTFISRETPQLYTGPSKQLDLSKDTKANQGGSRHVRIAIPTGISFPF